VPFAPAEPPGGPRFLVVAQRAICVRGVARGSGGCALGANRPSADQRLLFLCRSPLPIAGAKASPSSRDSLGIAQQTMEEGLRCPRLGLVWPGRAREQRVVRRSKRLGEVAAMVWSPDFGALGGRWGAEVLVLEPVRVAFEGEDLGMVHEPVDHRGGDDVVTEDLAPPNCSWHTFVVGDIARSSALSAVRASP
jgi:hypothetical protein